MWNKSALRAQKSILRFRNAFLMSYLDNLSKEKINRRLYDKSTLYRKVKLHDWESAWFDKEFYQLKSQNILIAACGAGREAVVLKNLGYEITAFDVSKLMIKDCQLRCEQEFGIFEASFTNFLDHFNYPKLGAILVGWGSIGHIFSLEDLKIFLRKLRTICPDGPILVSFPITQNHIEPYINGRIEQSARFISKTLQFYCNTSEINHPYQSFNRYEGFLRSFTIEEIQGCANDLDENCTIELEGYSHATFRTKA